MKSWTAFNADAGVLPALFVILVLLRLSSPVPAFAQWRNVNPNASAPIRFVTRSQDRLIGGRAADGVEVLASRDHGVTWSQTGSMAPGAVCGDVCLLSDGGPLVYCAFRQKIGPEWNVVVWRSVDGGDHWAFDSTVAHTTDGRFVGAPCLWFSRDGNVQCYYDDEETPTVHGHPGYQWISMRARPKRAFGHSWTSYTGVACRPSKASTIARDGMATAVDLPGSDMMLVTEGVDPANTARNCLFAITSHDNGRTWDYTSRQRIWAPIKNGVQFNAYAPMAIRVGGGPVGVAFCTDDDFASPSSDSAPPPNRNAHAKYIHSLSTYQQWGGLLTIDSSASTMYVPGLFEMSPNSLISTIDMFGHQRVNQLAN